MTQTTTTTRGARLRAPGAARRASLPWRRAGLARPGLVLAVAVLLLAVGFAVAPGVFAGADPLLGRARDALQPPSAAHWFGTDATGRDLFTRFVHGAVHSLGAALLAVGVGLVGGTALGVTAGSVGGWVDTVLMRLVDVLLSVPVLLLSLSIVILLGFGTTNAALAVGVASVATFARLSRSEVIRIRRSDYVEAAFGSGGTFGAVVTRHVLPNSLTPVIALAALQFGSAILQISTLGFLGYGAPPPTPEWGLLISEGRAYLGTAWWLTTLPGLGVVAVVLAANRLSHAIARGNVR